MINEEAIININALNAVCEQKDFYDEDFNKALKVAVKCIEKQSNIVHCKDCKNWSYPHYVEGFDKNAPIGLCELTKWFCGEQGYCMYGREVQDEID